MNNIKDKVISSEDMNKIKKMALKYNLSVSEFGREITRQSQGNSVRQIRVTSDELELIKRVSKNNGVNSMGRWCSLACTDFINKGDYATLYNDYKSDEDIRDKRINVPIENHLIESKLLEISKTYSIKISALIRYCAIMFSNNKDE